MSEVTNQLKQIKGDSLIAYVIRSAVDQGKSEEEICAFIRSQAMDNYPMMEAILGTKLLTTIINKPC